MAKGEEGGPDPECFDQAQGLPTGAPESPVLFVMFFAWFWRGLDNWCCRANQPPRLREIRVEEEKRLPTGNLVYADDANFIGFEECVTQDKVDFVHQQGPGVGLWLNKGKV